MDILLIHPEPRVRDLLSFALEGNFLVKVQAVADVELAVAAIEPKTKLIIYTFAEEKNDSFKKFIKAKSKIPSLLITSTDPTEADDSLDRDLVACVSQIELIDNLITEIQKLVNKRKLEFEDVKEYPESEYCRIRTQLLVDASPFKAGVYIRLTNQKIIKIFSPGDDFTASDLEKYYLKKQIEYFWLRKNETKLFIDNYRHVLEEVLKADVIDTKVATEVTVAANETLQELSTKLGFTDEVKALARTNMQIAVKAMNSLPGIKELLSRFDREKDKYIPAHSTILAFVACALSKEMTWGSEATFQKLTMAAFLHDITLANNSLAMVKDLKELQSKSNSFTSEEVKAYEQHPISAAELVRAFPNSPADVDTIIMQHHETPDGKGFPRKLSATHISPLSAVFIIAHDIVLGSIEGRELPAIIEDLNKKYTQGNFKKILKTIKVENLKMT
jgi:HD-GYP domain-containing protein (c-di-GMP phosphodiesterase class II)